MNPEFLSRLQFAFTASFHFIYPPISMGLGFLLVVMGIQYLRTGDATWRQASFFWVKIYGLVFAMGIATGIVQEFEFGMNWATYSRYVGNIFGSLLAAEGIFAFFLEGGFLGLLLFGGNRLGPKMWVTATFLVVFGAHFSALWILMANSWMQTPQGYILETTQWGQQAFMTQFRDVVFTPSFIPRLLHTWVASWMIGASLVLSVTAYYLLKKRHIEFAKKNFTLALWFFAILAILQVFIFGAQMAITVTNYQQPKLAAMEGVWESQACAPMYLVGWVNEAEQTTTGISIPCLLSILSYQNPQAVVTGLDAFPQDTWAPVNMVFQAYHIMIDLGFIFPLIGLVGLFFWWRKRKIFEMRWLLWIFVSTIVLTEAATIMGWWTAEIGRQPWIVWNLLRTVDAVSPVLTTNQVFISLMMFVVLYAILFVLFLFLLDHKIKEGPEPPHANPDHTDLPDTFREIFRQPRASAAGEVD
ncbi:MAG: cytochrome ubiquinol oxidase subunit I [Anaerolineae bacterium]|nr:cytochrome ubiquinol oxidase subunit I [Anaerolineae bacterium]